MKTKQKTAVESVAGLARFLEVTGSRSTWRNTVARVRYIHEQVRSGNHPNGPKIAEHFEVNLRTIYRDIQAMRNSLNLPLKFSVARNGYYYKRPVPSDLPRPKLGSGDLLAFCLARRALERFRGTDFAEIFERALRKIMDEVEGDVAFAWQALDDLVSVGPREKSRTQAEEIAAAVSEGLLRQRELAQKIVRSKTKSSKLGDATIAGRRERQPKEPGRQGGSPGDGESAELTMIVALTPELEQKILYWGPDVEVLEPAVLRKRIAKSARVIASREESIY